MVKKRRLEKKTEEDCRRRDKFLEKLQRERWKKKGKQKKNF